MFVYLITVFIPIHIDMHAKKSPQRHTNTHHLLGMHAKPLFVPS